MGSELADKPEINRIKHIINLNIMKCIKYKWYYVCVSVCGRGVPKCWCARGGQWELEEWVFPFHPVDSRAQT